MLRNKQLLILTGVFGLLLIYVLITQSGDKGFNTVVLPAFETFMSDEISKIKIATGDQEIVFEKKADNWFITQPIEFAADKNKINAFTKALSEMRLTDKISDQLEVDADYGLNSLSANVVTMTNLEEKSKSIYLGKPNTSSTHTFAALKEDPAVYQVIGNFEQHFNQTPEQWRSLTIFDFSRDSVQGFSIKRKGKKELTVKKEEIVEENIVADTPQGVTPTSLPTKMVWQVQGVKEPLNEPKVNQFLNAYTRLTANELVEKGQFNKKPLATITVTTIDKTHILSILRFDKEKKQYLAQSLSDKVWYLIPEYQGKNFLKDIKDFN